MDRVWIVVIGGLIPAFAFGTAAIFQKGAVQAGMGPGSYLAFMGLAMLVSGLVLRPLMEETGWGGAGIPLVLVAGVLFAIASGAIAFAMQRLAAPVSLIAPITVISTLVTVVLSFVVFREYESVSPLKVAGGALLVVAGAALVATS